MKKESLRDRLLRYLVKQHGWVSSATLQSLVLEHNAGLPRTAVRRLQELVEDGKLETQMQGKQSWFKAKDGIEAPLPPKAEHIRGVGTLKSYEQLLAEGKVFEYNT